VGEVGGAVERVHVPAVLGVEAVACAFLTKHAVAGEQLRQSRADQLFCGTVGYRDQIRLTFVLGFNAFGEELTQNRTGFARNLRGSGRPFERCGRQPAASIPVGAPGVARGRGVRLCAVSVMVRI